MPMLPLVPAAYHLRDSELQHLPVYAAFVEGQAMSQGAEVKGKGDAFATPLTIFH